jgi:hypothetical protein
MSNTNTVDEVLEVVAQVLIRCAVMGIIALLFWWGALELFGDLAYNVHSSIVPMSRQQFEIIHYSGMLITKIAVSLLFFLPFIGIKLVIKKRMKGSSNQPVDPTR